jgi:CRP-like cAMP-binding protein
MTSDGGPASEPSSPRIGGAGNWLLKALVKEEADAVRALLEPVKLESRHPIYEEGQPIEEVWFPIDCVVSLVADMPDGRPVEIATVGAEGMVGLPLVLGTEVADTRVFVQVPGQALRMSASAFTSLLGEFPGLNRLLLRYTEGLFLQVARSAACNQVHPIAQRAARWLLMTHDRAGRDEFSLTQEFLAQMLGVRRAGVSEVASALSRAGLIRYQRGEVTITDRAGLEEASCGCYRIIQDGYEGLLLP